MRNMYFQLLCCVFVHLRKLHLCLGSARYKHVSSEICVWIFLSEWVYRV